MEVNCLLFTEYIFGFCVQLYFKFYFNQYAPSHFLKMLLWGNCHMPPTPPFMPCYCSFYCGMCFVMSVYRMHFFFGTLKNGSHQWLLCQQGCHLLNGEQSSIINIRCIIVYIIGLSYNWSEKIAFWGGLNFIILQQIGCLPFKANPSCFWCQHF